MAFQRERTKSANAIPIRTAWSATGPTTGSFKQRPGTALGTCRRQAFSAISPRPPSQSETRRLMAKRSLSTDSLFIIPQKHSLESEFQAVLGKTLFEKSVNNAEENIMAKGDSVIRWNDKPLSHSADSSPALRRSGPPIFQYRSAVTVKPTRCATPLVNKNQSFRTYFPKGKLDVNAVASAHGLAGHPTPNITPQIHRIRSAAQNNLRNFSLKQEYNDVIKETARERYWKRRAQLKVLEDCMRMDVIDEVLAKADLEIARRQQERAAAARAEAERLAELERIELEKKHLEEERLARLIENGAQTTITYIEEIKNAEKKPAKGKKKKGKRGKKGSSAGGKSGKSAKKKKKTPKGADDDYDPESIPASILKDGRLGSAGSEGSKKRVRFREKLTSTKTIDGSRSSSPKGKRSSSPGKKKKGKGKKGTSKKDPVVIPVEPPKPEPPPEVPPEPPVEVQPIEPKEPMVIQVDDPPEFVPAEEYRTKNQLVEDWLHYRTCKMTSKTQSLIIDLS